MKKTRMLCLPVLLGLLLIGALVGVASARPNARPLQQAWRVLTVASQACIPENWGEAWYHAGGDGEYLRCNNAVCHFVCPVDFPAAGEQAVGAVNVKRLTMYAYDYNSGVAQDTWVELNKTYPPTGAMVIMATAGTLGASTADPQAVMDTSIASNPVYRTQGPYLFVVIPQVNIKVYGFFIHYTW
jgi:hypothetical protein